MAVLVICEKLYRLLHGISKLTRLIGKTEYKTINDDYQMNKLVILNDAHV